VLAEVFDDEDHPPDAEFGAFAAVLGLKGSPFEDKGLLRAHIGTTVASRRRDFSVRCTTLAESWLPRVSSRSVLDTWHPSAPASGFLTLAAWHDDITVFSALLLHALLLGHPSSQARTAGGSEALLSLPPSRVSNARGEVPYGIPWIWLMTDAACPYVASQEQRL